MLKGVKKNQKEKMDTNMKWIVGMFSLFYIMGIVAISQDMDDPKIKLNWFMKLLAAIFWPLYFCIELSNSSMIYHN